MAPELISSPCETAEEKQTWFLRKMQSTLCHTSPFFNLGAFVAASEALAVVKAQCAGVSQTGERDVQGAHRAPAPRFTQRPWCIVVEIGLPLTF